MPSSRAGGNETAPAVRTLLPFGIYVILVGATFVTVPNVALGALGLPQTEEPWIHLLGYVALVLGVYYVVAAKSGAAAIARASVPVRCASAVVFLAVAAMWEYWAIALFALPDAAAAGWTWSALRRRV